jgi:hypothetical protein
VADRSKALDVNGLSAAIAKELGKLFDNIEIVNVIVTPDTDRDGDDFLRVAVIFAGDLRESDARKVAGVSRTIRPTLREMIDEDLCPLLSFVSEIDYKRSNRREAY